MDSDDVAQQVYFIALKAMEKYDPTHGPIFNFLSICVSNRIKNIIRDTTLKEVDTCSLDNIQDEYETIGNARTTSDEFWEMIDDNLHPSFRRDYIKMKQGIHVPKLRKEKVINEIRKIINETL